MKRIVIRGAVHSVLLLSIYSFLIVGAEAQAGYPRTFTDAGGHTLILKARPMRIASIVLGIDENLLDLVDPSRVVTMTELSRDPNISNAAARVPAGMTFIKSDWRPVVDANPDLVLVATYTPELAEPLIERGLPVYQFSEFHSVEALLKNFETLGSLVGEERKAQEILAARRDELAKASARRWDAPVRAVYYSEGLLFTRGTVPSQLIGFAGLVDAAADFGLLEIVKATPELIRNLRPDIILIGEDSAQAEAETMALFKKPEFQIIDAARSGRIYAIPGKHITTVSHHIVTAVRDIQALPIGAR